MRARAAHLDARHGLRRRDALGRGGFPGASPAERGQRLTRVRGRNPLDGLGRALRDHATALRAAFGTQVDDVVGGQHQVEVVLDHDHAVAEVDQLLQCSHQARDVLHVQAGGRLVQQIERVALGPALELGHQLQALRLAARERGRGLAQRQVAQADLDHDLQRPRDLGQLGEELERLLGGQGEDVRDRVPLEAHLERLGLEAVAAALLAGHGHGCQELQLDVLRARAAAGLAAPAGDVEREAPGRVAAHLGLGQLGEQVADGREHPRVRGRVRARRAPDRRGVDGDQLVDVLQAPYASMVFRLGCLAAQMARDAALHDAVHERRLARAADAGDDREAAQGERDVDLLEVEGAGALDDELVAQAAAALARGLEDQLAAQELAGGGVEARDGAGRARARDAPALATGAGADVDQPVGGAQRRLVVLDHHHRVAQVAQALERDDQALVVARVQADRGLVEDVQHALQPRAELGRQADALGLAARERVRAAVERQVAQPDLEQELDPALDLVEQVVRDAPLARSEREPPEAHAEVCDRQARQLPDAHIAQAHRVGHRLEARAGAGLAVLLGEIPLHALLVQPGLAGLLDRRQDAREAPLPLDRAGVLLALPAGLVGEALLARAVQDHLARGLRELLPGRVEVEAVRLGHLLEELEVDRREHQRAARDARHGQRAGADRERGIAHDGAGRGTAQETQALALGAGSVRRVEREQARLERRRVGAAIRAGAAGREGALAAVRGHDHVARPRARAPARALLSGGRACPPRA
jgi:hypothetical protein